MPQSKADPRAIVARIVERVREAGPARGILGSHLGMFLKAVVAPKFDPTAYGVSSLKAFIEAHAADKLKVMGYSKMDPVYGLAEWDPSGVIGHGYTKVPFDPWRAWTSPESPVNIAVSHTTGAVRTAAVGERLEPDEALLTPVPTEGHRRLAREFLARVEVSPSLRELLSSAAEEEGAQWWRKWNASLRSSSPELTRDWFEFRLKALKTLLRARLREAHIHGPAAERAFKDILTGHRDTGR